MDDTGYHYIFDFKLKSNKILTSPKNLDEIFSDVLREFTILKYDFFKFNEGGEGVTGFYLLSESHCSYHTYPESNYIAVDIFTCGRDPGNVAAELKDKLGAVSYFSHFIKRGSSSIACTRLEPSEKESAFT
ncbi:adenosylmethionine decarboxylase [Glaciimonas sp. GG7]